VSTSFASRPAIETTRRRPTFQGAPPNAPNPDDAERILKSIRQARQRADIVIVYQHNHVFGNRSFANLEYQGKTLRSISVRPIVLNVIGEGHPDVQDPRATNAFLFTRGLPAPATRARAGYILERLSELSKPFGTRFAIERETASIIVNH
jgi:hypothetical protein